MLLVGLSGNIGSGKTTLARIFREWGVPVYYADEAGRMILRQAEVREKIERLFGEEVMEAGGQVDRKKLAEMVFSSHTRLKQLNDLIHPLVRKDFKSWADSREDAPYVIQEAAILFESGQHVHFDRIIFVSAPEDLRMERVMKRDGISRAEVEQRAQHQLDEKQKIMAADYVVVNDGHRPLLPQALAIHRQILGQWETQGKNRG